MNSPPILYIEDDENDAFLLQRAFHQADISNRLVVLSDGDAAVDYFSGTGPYENRAEHPLPALVLLDLNMPGRSGFDVLNWIRHDPGAMGIPAIVLTSSHHEGDIARAYAEHANAYLVKPNEPDELVVMVKALRDFWLLHNHAPAAPNLVSAGA